MYKQFYSYILKDYIPRKGCSYWGVGVPVLLIHTLEAKYQITLFLERLKLTLNFASMLKFLSASCKLAAPSSSAGGIDR